MNEPVWLTVRQIKAMHAEQLALFGGPDGIRDDGLLESALSRPLNRWHYGTSDLPSLAAAYAFGIARNHAFLDGNKRTAFAVMMVFLRRNGVSFAPLQADATAVMLALAAGEIAEEALARWIADNLPEPT